MPQGNNPFALGRITPAGAAARLTANFPALYGNSNAGLDLFASSIEVNMSSQAPGPVGYFGYIGMNITTGVGVLREMIPGETLSFSPPRGGSLLHVGDYCVLGTDNTDYFQCSAWEG